MTETPKNPKLPLTKGSRSLFEKRFQELYLKEAEKGTSDEALMKAVNDYEENNPNSATGQAQKKVQDEGGIEAFEGAEGTDESGTVNISELTEDQKQELVKESYNRYFDLFGSQPLTSMSFEQVLNSILVKEIELEKGEKPVVDEKPSINLKEGQVLAKNEAGEERVFEKRTLEYLPEWTQVVSKPNEIKNQK